MRHFNSGRFVGAVAVASFVLSVGACQSTRLDRYEYVSRHDLLKTVRVTDVWSDESLWRRDVPVDHRLVIEVDRELDLAPWIAYERTIAQRPLRMRWWEYAPDVTKASGSGDLDLAGIQAELRVYVRRPDTPVAAVEPPPVLPESGKTGPVLPGAGREPIVITILSDGQYLLVKETYEPNEVDDLVQTLEGIATTSPDESVLIRALENTPFKLVAQMMSVCRKLGLEVAVAVKGD